MSRRLVGCPFILRWWTCGVSKSVLSQHAQSARTVSKHSQLAEAASESLGSEADDKS